MIDDLRVCHGIAVFVEAVRYHLAVFQQFTRNMRHGEIRVRTDILIAPSILDTIEVLRFLPKTKKCSAT